MLKKTLIKNKDIFISRDEEAIIGSKGIEEKSEPEIINRVGDSVDSIDVICTCGKKTHIVLEYESNLPDGSQEKQASSIPQSAGGKEETI